MTALGFAQGHAQLVTEVGQGEPLELVEGLRPVVEEHVTAEHVVVRQ